MNQKIISKFLLINKPKEWTSFDVVKKIRGFLKKKYNFKKVKVGHCGTLDPLASGLLIICSGVKTKEIKKFEALNKVYIATIKLGCVTDSFDGETEEKNHKEYSEITINNIKSTLHDFIGKQQQTPPIYSAIKLNGERLYKKARRGEINIKLNPREVVIFELKLLSFKLPFIKFEIKCAKGTYIRSLANDIGLKLGCGAYLTQLIRTKIGQYQLKSAIDIDQLESAL